MRPNPLPTPAFTLLVMVGALLAFFAYWTLLLDWVEGYRTSVCKPLEAGYQLAAHILYLYAGVRFLKNRIRFF